jgi:hypothetical protein
VRHIIFLALMLSACSTADVQQRCAEAERILQVAQPFLSAAPASVQIAVTAIGAGTVACGTPQYAEMRETVLAWLRIRGVGI